MKVGTDGVLLGAWAEGGARILDIGTGTGVVALMMAQRFPGSRVDAVEADGCAALQAAENAAGWPQVRVHGVRLQQFEPSGPYDSIVSNPPYFSGSLHPPDAQRCLARHDVGLSFDDIVAFASRWLTTEGVLSVVLPSEMVERFAEEACLRGFRMCRQTLVRTVPRKPAKRQLVAFSRSVARGFGREEQCLQRANGSRSEWYAGLTREFYL